MYKCVQCGKEFKDLKPFYATYSNGFKAYENHLPICKECFVDLYIELLNSPDYKDDECLAMYRLCMMYDIWYNESIWLNCVPPPETVKNGRATEREMISSRIGNYMRMIHIKQNRSNTFETTLKETKKHYQSTVDLIDDSEISEDDIVTQEVIDRFGSGYDYKEYQYLQKEYDDWLARVTVTTKQQEEVYIRLAQIKLEIRKAIKDHRSTKDLDKTQLDLFNAAGILSKQAKDNSSSQGKTFPQMIAEWEAHDPILDPLDEWKDVDHIREQIEAWYMGGLANGLGLEGNLYTTKYFQLKEKYGAKAPQGIEEEEITDVQLHGILFGENYE